MGGLGGAVNGTPKIRMRNEEVTVYALFENSVVGPSLVRLACAQLQHWRRLRNAG